MSFVGSYTNLRGGQIYSSLIRKTEPKPLRVFLQDGQNDQSIYGGNWFIGNRTWRRRFTYAGYDTSFVVGTEGHNNKHGSAILRMRCGGCGATTDAYRHACGRCGAARV